MLYVRIIIFLTVLSFSQVSCTTREENEFSVAYYQTEYSLEVLNLLNQQKVSMCFYTKNNTSEIRIAYKLLNNITNSEDEEIDQVKIDEFLSNILLAENEIIQDFETFNEMDIPRLGCMRRSNIQSVMELQIRELKTTLKRQITFENLLIQLCRAEIRFKNTLAEIMWDSDVLRSIKVKTLILFMHASVNSANPIDVLTRYLRPIMTNSILYAPSLTQTKQNEYYESIITCIWNHSPSEWSLDEFTHASFVIFRFMIELLDTNPSLHSLSSECIRLKSLIRQHDPSATDGELYPICDYARHFERNFYREFTSIRNHMNSFHALLDDIFIIDRETCRYSAPGIDERLNNYIRKYLLIDSVPIGFPRTILECILYIVDQSTKYLNLYNNARNMANFERNVKQRLLGVNTRYEPFSLEDYPEDEDIFVIQKLESQQIRCFQDKYRTTS